MSHLTATEIRRLSLGMTKVEEANDATLAASGAPGDFRLLVERHSHHLFRLAYRMTGNQQDAEDLVQESFLRAYRNWGRFEARSNFGTWLHRICVNAALDHLRQRRKPEPEFALEELADHAAGPERLLLSSEKHAEIEAAMAQLSPVERAAFALRHYEQQSIAEIGACLGLREAATKNTIFRGVRKLRRALAPHP